ncbi:MULTISPECIES: peptide chain release factor 2 [unclassified Lebetimonas]|uniref:peptide chain release factor 2 n=1 Tax=unclassified Lebetimonas TaxID=2648158 RepID=UPI0004663675|nr:MULTISPECIES: peptide chain release factor 2 [unclassified Lebetimonas]
MDAFEYSELSKELENKLNNIKAILKPDEIKKRLSEIEQMENEPEFWNDPKKSAKIQKEKNILLKKLNKYLEVEKELMDNNDMYELASAEEDEETLGEVFNEAQKLKDKIRELEIEVMLSDENDSKNAIITIHPGAGGTESHDWASMLYRMYLRFAERKGWKVKVLDYQAGDEAGIKDATILIEGDNAYGYLKTENGIHRLVRVSPFDSGGRRHTSFASVQVSPEIDDDIDIEIDPKDIRLDVFRASGAGGQHVNKTESAVRITHIPTGIVVSCQQDRSQHKNKEMAFKMLKSKLYEFEAEKRRAEEEGKPKDEMGWGHQIRSYVLFPYQQVKDVRSNKAYSKVDDILDGDLQEIIEDVLISEKEKS